MLSAYAAAMPPATVIIALGANRCSRHGRPDATLRAAIAALAAAGLVASAVAPVIATRAIGPGGRDYANTVMTSLSTLQPVEILSILQRVEREFGRRGGRRWGARVLDLDLIAVGEMVWPSRFQWRRTRGLAVPHRAMHRRRFVLDPLAAVAPDWRHPVLGLTTRQLRARLRKG
jgi:2-amino-4-hydroxy-6-hydroxymethyldihydropteridine diphosphokinase